MNGYTRMRIDQSIIRLDSVTFGCCCLYTKGKSIITTIEQFQLCCRHHIEGAFTQKNTNSAYFKNLHREYFSVPSKTRLVSGTSLSAILLSSIRDNLSSYRTAKDVEAKELNLELKFCIFSTSYLFPNT